MNGDIKTKRKWAIFGRGPFPDVPPKSIEELRALIARYERRGVDAKEAWRIYNLAAGANDPSGFITAAFNELSRKKNTRDRTRGAIAVGVALLVLITAPFALNGLLLKTLAYRNVIIWGDVIAIAVLAAVFTSLISAVKKCQDVFDVSDWKVPEDVEQLESFIIRSQRLGVNVAEAWSSYEKAAEANAEVARGGAGTAEGVRLLIKKTYAELLRKIELRKNSSFAVVFSFVPLVPLMALIYFRDQLPRDLIIFGIPVFVVIWGIIGGVCSALLSAWGKIKRQELERLDVLGYAYRIALGGVLAGVTFYVLQLGLVSLPGMAGEQVNAALERAGAAKKYREALGVRDIAQSEIDRQKLIMGDFDKAAMGLPEDKAKALLKYSYVWVKYSPICTGGSNSVAAPTGEPDAGGDARPPAGTGETLTATRISSELDEYSSLKVEVAGYEIKAREYFRVLTKLIESNKKQENPERYDPAYDKLADEMRAAQDDVKRRLDAASRYAATWGPHVKGAGGDFTAVNVSDTATNLGAANQKLAKLEQKFGAEFEVVQCTVIPEVTKGITKANRKLAEAEKTIRQSQAYLESVDLEEKIKAKNDEIKKQEEPKGKGVAVEESGGAAARSVSNSPPGEIETLKNDRTKLEAELKNAYKNEAGRPVWEGPVFIVVAFISGYSVGFSTRLIQTFLKSVQPKDEEQKGPAGPRTGNVAPNVEE